MKTFSLASDNTAPAHPRILEAMQKMESHAEKAYGQDAATQALQKRMNELFGTEVFMLLCTSGTAANLIAIGSLLKSYEAVLSSEISHIHVDECSALESLLGHKILLLPACNGKIDAKTIASSLKNKGVVHHPQPGCLSLTQATESGTVYDQKELQNLIEAARKGQLKIHMDGARLSNACAFLKTEPAVLCQGIDVVSFGGTKNGLSGVEVLVFFNQEYYASARYLHKQMGQLSSKMRYQAIQFLAFLEDNLYLQLAEQANQKALFLRDRLKDICSLEPEFDVQTNALFVRMPQAKVKLLWEQGYHFYVWDEALSLVRLMTSWNTKEADLLEFCHSVKRALSSKEGT